MAKGQMRSNKEVRKPKKDQKAGAGAGAAPAAPTGSKFSTPPPELVKKKKERPA